MKNLIYKLLEINIRAQWILAGNLRDMPLFSCRGKIYLYVDKSANVVTPQKKCYVGLPLLGYSTPPNDITVISLSSEANLTLNGCLIGKGVRLVVGKSGKLNIRENSYVTDGSRISAQNSIFIGKGCAISFGVTIMDDDGHGFGPPPYSAPIIIEDNVWIGCNVTVLKGVTIGEGSVVAAGAVVTKSCPPHSLIAGVPAKVIREGVNWTDKNKLGLKNN